MSTLADFPVEIWQHIATYLPSNFVKTLYSVNRPFLHLALDARYRVARVTDFERHGVQRTLLDQNVRQRARIILIDDDWDRTPSSINTTQAKKEPTGFRSLFSILSHTQKKKPKEPLTNAAWEQYYDKLLLVVPSLPSVREIDLRLYNPLHKQYVQKLRLTQSLLETAGANLAKFAMHLTLEDLHKILPTSPILPQLAHLRIVLRAAKETADPDTIMLSVVKPFLVKQSHTIVSLELIGAHTVEISNLLQNLPHFPQLVKIYLSHHIRSGDPEQRLGFTQFMALHASQLVEFRYHMRGSPFMHHYPKEWFSDAGDATFLDFPQLTRLTVSAIPRNVFSSKNMIRHLERYRTTLTTLRLQIDPLSYTEILELLQCLTGSNSLRCLNVLVNCLGPTILGQFASALPNLDDLTLNFCQTILTSTQAPSHVASAIQTPWHFEVTYPDVTRMLQTWNLMFLSLVPVASRLALLPEVRNAIIASLPRVRSFCELEPAEYAAADDDPGVKLSGPQAYNFGERY